VYDYLADLEHTPEWNWAITETRKVTPGPVTVGTRYRQTRSVPRPSTEELVITALEPNRLIEVDGTLGQFPAHLSYQLESSGAGTALTNAVDLQTEGALRLIGPLVRSRVRQSVADNLDKLKSLLESSSRSESASRTERSGKTRSHLDRRVASEAMSYPTATAAARAGVNKDSLSRYRNLGLVGASGEDVYSDVDILRMQVFQMLEDAGVPIEAVATMAAEGHMSLDFIESAGRYVFVPLSDRTFGEVSEETGVPVETLSVIREALGGGSPRPEDRMGEEELAVVPLVEFQLSLGFRSRAIEQALRVYGESLRRMAETEAEWFRSEIVEPMLGRGQTEDDVGRLSGDMSPVLSELSNQAVLAIYHRQQRHAWSVNIIDGIAMSLERAGLHPRDERIPAMCFLDITGYTRLTQERGDQAAADLAGEVRRVVERRAVAHRGRAVKWLGDGVMLQFPEPGSAVESAVKMVMALEEAGMPLAHVGVHAGPVIFREGDYYGQTVNIASRISDFARPGEVLVSQAVVDLATGIPVVFSKIGPVELKGVGDVLVLYAANRGASQ
jgi:adenylate cyclase